METNTMSRIMAFHTAPCTPYMVMFATMFATSLLSLSLSPSNASRLALASPPCARMASVSVVNFPWWPHGPELPTSHSLHVLSMEPVRQYSPVKSNWPQDSSP